MFNRNTLLALTVFLLVALALGACGGSKWEENIASAATTQNLSPVEEQQVEDTTSADDHDSSAEAETAENVEEAEEELAHSEDEEAENDDDHGPTEHMMGSHDVPLDAAAVANPIQTSSDSVERGATVFSQSCAVCHGETGKGDGPAAAGLEPKPADLYADHVRSNTDGAMFWIISHGREDTAMPPWDNIVNEEDRWHLVNFIRSFSDRQ